MSKFVLSLLLLVGLFASEDAYCFLIETITTPIFAKTASHPAWPDPPPTVPLVNVCYHDVTNGEYFPGSGHNAIRDAISQYWDAVYKYVPNAEVPSSVSDPLALTITDASVADGSLGLACPSETGPYNIHFYAVSSFVNDNGGSSTTVGQYAYTGAQTAKYGMIAPAIIVDVIGADGQASTSQATNITLHEFGHWFGLADTYVHSNPSLCVTNPDGSTQPISIMCLPDSSKLTNDDIAGAQCVYCSFRRTMPICNALLNSPTCQPMMTWPSGE